jgi:hypothetical protein
MRINKYGCLGICTNNPSYTLDTNGHIRATGAIYAYSGTGNGYISLNVGNGSVTGYLSFYYPNGNRGAYLGNMNTTDNYLQLTCENGCVGLITNGELRTSTTLSIVHGAPWDHMKFWHDGGTAYMDAGGAENGIAFRINTGGSVYPATSYTECMRLSGAGNVTATGGIRTEGTTATNYIAGYMAIGSEPTTSYRLEVSNGNMRINGDFYGAYNCVKRLSTYILPTYSYASQYYYFTINYANYLCVTNLTEYAFRIYVYNIGDNITSSYAYIGTVLVSKTTNPYPYHAKVIDHYAYGVYTPVVSDVDTIIGFQFLNDTYSSQTKKVVFENIAFSTY